MQKNMLAAVTDTLEVIERRSLRELRQLLLDDSMQLLLLLARITAACLEQLAAQLGNLAAADMAVVAFAGDTCAALIRIVAATSSRPYLVTADFAAPSSPSDRAVLRLLQAELLPSHATAARAATGCLTRLLDQLSPSRVQPPAAARQRQSSDPRAAAACEAATAVVSMWSSCSGLLPAADMLQPGSVVVELIQHTAELAMCIVRLSASTGIDAALVISNTTLMASVWARAAGPAPDTHSPPAQAVLQREAVLEVLLLGLAASAGQVHAECNGTSQQPLLKSLAAAGCSRSSGSSSSSSSKSSASSSSSQMRVPPYHEELIQALVGVRQLPALQKCQNALAFLSTIAPLVVSEAGTARLRAGSKYVPLQYAAPLELTLIELAALAPPCYTDEPFVLCELLRQIGNMQLELRIAAGEQLGEGLPRQQAAAPAAGVSAAQRIPAWAALAPCCLRALWLELGPVLLSLCSSRASEAAADEGGSSGSGPRAVLGWFAEAFLRAMTLQREHVGSIVGVSAVVSANPQMCCLVAEAALHALFASPPGGRFQGSQLRHLEERNVQMQVLAEFCSDAVLAELSAAAETPWVQSAAGAGAAATAQQQQRAELLAQQVFGVLAAALKHVVIVQPDSACGPLLFMNQLGLLAGIICAGLRLLGIAGAWRMSPLHDMTRCVPPAPVTPQLSAAQQLVMFALLARCLAAAGVLLQELPRQVAPAIAMIEEGRQIVHIPLALLQHLPWACESLMAAVVRMQQMLQPGGVAAGTAAAGMPGVGVAAGAGLLQLQQQCSELLQGLTVVAGAVSPECFDKAGNWSGPLFSPASAHQDNRHALIDRFYHVIDVFSEACEPRGGGLPQQLAGFGAACYAAFPQPRCCGNAACSSTDKFSEAALASRSCSACQAVKFCSRECLKAAWKAGHQAACPLLK